MKPKATNYAATLAKTIGRFNEAIEGLISIYLAPLKHISILADVLVIGC